VVRSGSGKSSETGRWEDSVEAIINKNPIKTGHDRIGLAVRLGETTSKKGELVDPKGQDSFVKSRHKRGMNQAIAFLVGRANQIEIPCNEPGTINLWKKLQEVFEEGAGVTVVSWSVHVGDS
jgi:hypothetical protein